MKSLSSLILLLLITDACVDRLEVKPIESDLDIVVVDGLITNEPGPYTIKLFRASGLDDILNFSQPVLAQRVTIIDDLGNSEVLQNRVGGIFETDPSGIRGEVGRKYHVNIELPDGTLLESIPDELRQVKDIDSIYFEWQSFLPISGPAQNGFRVFMDTRGDEGMENFLRWKFTGTYMVTAFPELNHALCNCCELKGPPKPFPCSGVEWTGFFLKTTSPCACCFCWVTDFENKPRLSDNQIVTDGSFKKVEMGFVPFDQFTFSHNKYMVKVEQMSLSNQAFEFWKVIKDQKEGINSLFQPAFGKVKTNIFSPNAKIKVTGIFYASAVKKKILFITGGDAPIPVPPFDIVPPETNCALWRPCNQIFPNASTTPPPDWK